MNKKDRTIGIDARLYGPKRKGLGRYIKEVIDRLLEADKENDFVVFLYKDNFDDFRSGNPRVRKVRVDARWYGLKEQFLMPYLIWKEKIGLMHFPHFNVPIFSRVRKIVTIHDLILARHKTAKASTLHPLFYKLKYFFYKIVIFSAVKTAYRIIAVSEFTKKDIIGTYGIRPEKIKVTYQGAYEAGRTGADDSETILRYNIKKPYLLYVGNAYPHKNLEVLLPIMVELRREIDGLSLVFVGKEDYFYRQLKEKAAGLDFAVFAGFVPDSELPAVYRQALAYVFPSLYEGFGLPPLEAMAQGCPVASSDRASMPEILGDAAVYFDPENAGDVKKRILEIALNEGLRAEMKERGYRQVKKYGWNRCAAETLEIYREALKDLR